MVDRYSAAEPKAPVPVIQSDKEQAKVLRAEIERQIGHRNLEQVDDADFDVQLLARYRLATAASNTPSDVMREALKPFAAMADEWDRWQAKGSTSTPAMVQFTYGRRRIGLPEYQAARFAVAGGSGR